MGPLTGIKILEIAGIGPGPFAAMMLSDMGADVLRLDRADCVPEAFPDQPHGDLLNRGRRSVGVNLKSAEGVEAVLTLVESADVILEGFRPGVMERLGLGPEVCLERNPRIIYGRVTGFGQDGPLATRAGHDINYISIAGAVADPALLLSMPDRKGFDDLGIGVDELQASLVAWRAVSPGRFKKDPDHRRSNLHVLLAVHQ